MINLDDLAKVSASSQDTFAKLQQKVNDASFTQGNQEELFGDRGLYWRPTPNEELSTPAAKVVYRIMPQPHCDLEELALQEKGEGTFELDNPSQYQGLNLVGIDHYQFYQRKNAARGIKGGKFECIAPTFFNEEDLLFKFIREIYNDRYGKFAKGSPERKDGITNWLNMYKPKRTYKTNVLVLRDTTRPETVGKVWLHSLDQATLRKKLLGDLDTNDHTGSFLAKTDQFGDAIEYNNGLVKGSTDVLNALSAGTDTSPSGAAIQLNLIYETKNFGKGDVLVTDFKNSKMEPYKHQTLFEDVAEFMFDGKNNKACKEKVTQLWQQEHSLLKYYDRSKYYIEPQKMVDNFCQFLNIDEYGKQRTNATTSIGVRSNDVATSEVLATNVKTTLASNEPQTENINISDSMDLDAMLADMQSEIND